jgi:GTP-binding protein HflX
MKQFKKKRFLLVGIQPHHVPDNQAFSSWRELWQLVESYGGQVVDTIIQKREVHDKGMYIGAGKLAEVQQMVTKKGIDVVVLHDVVKPGQLYEMQVRLTRVRPELEVWDRVDLVLQIFSQHAHTAAARLQIELASMRHMGPRIYGLGAEMSRQGGGIGGRGIGETNTERMKRHWAAQMKKVEQKLDKLAHDRTRQLAYRRRVGMQTVSLVGYTNAGKTSLYNALVGKQKFAESLLFATLDASVGKLYLPTIGQELLVSDTIGFIQGLPPELLQAFKSTLMESIFADMLLQVIDASDAYMADKIEVVNDIIADLGLVDRPRVYVFTKIDQAKQLDSHQLSQQYRQFHPQFVSSQTGQGLNNLIEQLVELLHVPSGS